MKIGNLTIGYLSDYGHEYQSMLGAAQSLAALQAGIALYDPLVWMDTAPVKDWSEAKFSEFKEFLARERNAHGGLSTNTPAALEEFSPIVMPMPMFRIDLVSNKFHAPFGATLIRLIELNIMRVHNQRVTIIEKKGKAT